METFIKVQLYNLIQKSPTVLDFVYSQTIDFYGNFESVNIKNEWLSPDFLIKLGYTTNEIESNKILWEDVVFKEDVEVINLALVKIKEETSFILPIRYLHKNGYLLNTKFIGFRVKDNKKSEVVLGAHNFLIDFDAFENEKQLIEKQNLNIKNLENKNKELTQFSYLASHDLQQPLNNIISYLSILEENKNRLDDLEQLSITVIKKSSYKMKRYITSLLEYSIIGTKAREDKVVLNEVFSSVKEILADQIKEKNAVLDFPSNNLIMIGNQNDIHLLFLNLIENSIKFTKNEVDTKIVIDCKSENDDFLFSISDNGIGIDKIDNNKVFDIFFKINNEDNFKGIGMGLAICKKIIELYAGKIWIDSELNKGTIVYFSLPKITFC
ncbi:PAS domain-containing sensor histidine kinase [Polaribacter ponticola]|uniref:histidine kinase n=1 Tax=Polaribacter ponticola TaxID=2978475 RepID=A0ABT5SC81_9FLAO|nr:PAS domain-containing sensor histidine kinase [Polaribacter sp. MSW5]MDD7915734.1 PAS domain-containing sensor histidine kinase [Polaribacter sp. MSW5]